MLKASVAVMAMLVCWWLPTQVLAQVTLNYSGETAICSGDQTTLAATLEDPGQSCTFYLEMNDGGGQGWQGTTIDVVVNGSIVLNTTVASGFQHIDTITLNQNDSVELYYNQPGFDFDNAFGLIDANGTVLFSANGFVNSGLVYAFRVDCGAPSMADYTVSWSPATGVSNTTAYQPVLSPSATTTYTVTLSDLQGNVVSTTNVTIDVGTNFTVAATASPNSLCIGGSSSLLASPSDSTETYTYQWTNASFLSSGTGANPTATFNTDGVVDFVVTAQNSGGCIRLDTVTVTVSNAVQATVAISGDTAVCDGDSVALFAQLTPATPPSCDFTFVLSDGEGDGWDFGAEVQIWLNGALAQTLTVPNGFSQTFTLPLLQGDLMEVYYNPSFFGGFGNSYEIFDANGTSIFQDFPGQAGGLRFTTDIDCGIGIDSYTLLWSPAASISDPTADSVMAGPAATTTYMVIATEPACGYADTAWHTVNVVPGFSITTSATPSGICLSDTTLLMATVVGNGIYSYDWTPASLLDDPTVANPTATFTAGDAYDFEVTVSSDSGCTQTAIAQVFVSSSVQGILSVTGDTSVCAGDPTELQASLETPGGNLCDYTLIMDDANGDGWDPGSEVQIYSNGILVYSGTVIQGAQQVDMIQLVEGATIEVVFQIGFFFTGGQSYALYAPGNTLVMSDPGPFPQIGTSYTGVVDCGYSFDGYTFAWSPTTGVSDPTSDTVDVTPPASGMYTLVASDTLCGYTDTVSINLAVVPGFEVAVTPGDTALCLNESLGLSAMADTAGSFDYTWSPAGLFSSPVGQFPTATFSSSGLQTVSVEVASAWGCEVTSSIDVLVSTAAVPEVTIEGGPNLCLGDSIQLTADVGAQEGELCNWVLDLDLPQGFDWGGAFVTISLDGAATAYSPANQQAEIFNIAVAHGASIEVSFNPGFFGGGQRVRLYDQDGFLILEELPVQFQVLYTGTVNCGGNDDAVYLFDWMSSTNISSSTTQDPMIWPQSDTTYVLAVTDSVGGCTAVDSIAVTVAVSTPVTATQPTGMWCSADAIPVNLSASEPDGTWSGNGIIDAITGQWLAQQAGAGTHDIVYTLNDFGNCATADTIQLQVDLSPTSPAAGPVTVCTGEELILTSSSTGTVEWYDDFNLTNLVATGDTLNLGVTTGSGLYFVIGVNGNCASASSVINYTVETAPNTPPFTGSNNPTAWNTELYTTPGTANATYEWIIVGGTLNSAQGGTVMSVSWGGEGTGSLSLIETSANGCAGDTTTLTVTIGPNAIGELSATPQPKLYPNPASDRLFVELPEIQAGKTSWLLMDLTGKTVKSGFVAQSQKFSLNVGELSPGVYVISISGAHSWHQRITVQP